MRATNWSQRTDPEKVAKRAAGRTHYNRVRQSHAFQRLREVVRLQGLFGFGHGTQAEIARHLGVSRSTICRDFKKINEMFWSYLAERRRKLMRKLIGP